MKRYSTLLLLVMSVSASATTMAPGLWNWHEYPREAFAPHVVSGMVNNHLVPPMYQHNPAFANLAFARPEKQPGQWEDKPSEDYHYENSRPEQQDERVYRSERDDSSYNDRQPAVEPREPWEVSAGKPQ